MRGGSANRRTSEEEGAAQGAPMRRMDRAARWQRSDDYRTKSRSGWGGGRRRPVLSLGGRGGWRRPAPGKEEEAGRGGVAMGKFGRRQKRENGRRGFHFIVEGREPATGKARAAPRMAAGGHERWLEMARPFRVIEGAIQGGKFGGIEEEGKGINSPLPN
uniref:Uncharacterized protein n=2 Tax=Oryza sativa subsp. japonica TaxID=39947 RepID=Q10IF8_ORYSJ|nr:hypothetical protein [Oryza sativa Japonica Group]ABF97031.1 hypothetical protein LOC_Os03g35360 [Oryza sativa Japonica Group]